MDPPPPLKHSLNIHGKGHKCHFENLLVPSKVKMFKNGATEYGATESIVVILSKKQIRASSCSSRSFRLPAGGRASKHHFEGRPDSLQTPETSFSGPENYRFSCSKNTFSGRIYINFPELSGLWGVQFTLDAPCNALRPGPSELRKQFFV